MANQEANCRLIFSDIKGDYNFECTHDIDDYSKNKSCIILEVSSYPDETNNSFIQLDISTAIKFAKTLRTEINKAKELEEDMKSRQY